ncbi:fungal-specific transcription factor domain-containing protein [Cristinia sonorae]|uniref:Fungal-specific transcription factor domain-containing protein n=1 Tax=Cristinia sonorae TaxID=1940300 RepID=A0A8K0XN18_9AGAR|nr:fungal-specific transcription factor domain-containing protein [Cristinia sonorae]
MKLTLGWRLGARGRRNRRGCQCRTDSESVESFFPITQPFLSLSLRISSPTAMSSPDASLNRPPDDPNAVKKRKRGATRLSCAECRRLKLRCDRAIPCGSCLKRGCAQICPDGALTTGKGNRSNRFVLASTQDLHEKISELSNRVRDLEDGLRASHAQHSKDTHPLLSDDLLRIKAPIQREGLHINGDGTHDGQAADVVDSFGSLKISDTGLTNYYGQATSSWYYLQNEGSRQIDRDNRLMNLRHVLPQEVLALAGFFPVAPNIPPTVDYEMEKMERLRSLSWYLPRADEAADLRQIYYTHAAWMYNPVSESQFNDHIFYQFFSPDAPPPTDDPLLSHQLALMYMVLAIGSLMDIKRPAYNIDAEKYHQLARAALFQSPIFEEPTLNAVQALYLMAFYLFLVERHGTGVGSRWAFMGLAVKLGVSMGLHRDAGRWNVDFAEIQRRREAFWEIYSYDLLQSYTLGRPPSFTLAHIDCKKPHSEDPCNEETFHWWKHRFTSECMNTVYDQAFGAKTPTYSTVLQLDRKLRAFPVPQILQIAGFGITESRGTASFESIPLILQRHVVLAVRESHLLYMHRGFYARAISDHPKDPLGSPYGSSFIAAYRSAGSLVALVRNIHSQLKELTERMWFLWTHLFSCSIILGSIVTRCPSMSLAPSALVQLDSACDLFSKTAHFFHAESVLDIMLKLRERAHMCLAAHRNNMPIPSPSRTNSLSVSEPSTPADDQDELSILGGRTRLVASKEKSVSPQIADRSPTSLNPVVPLPLSRSEDQQVHPYVLEYLRTFVPPTNGIAHEQSQEMQMAYEPAPQSPVSPSSANYVNGGMHYPPQQQPQQQPMGPLDGLPQQSLPQYFPVFDYSNVGLESFATIPTDGDFARAYSPETSMQSAWQDFVAQIGM